MQITLNFINQVHGAATPTVFIFQKNVRANLGEQTVAWKVIENCGYGFHHPFQYSTELDADIGDSYGNFSPRLTAKNGGQFSVSGNALGAMQFQQVGTGGACDGITIRNDLTLGAIDANIYRNGQLMLRKCNVAPGQEAVFQVKPAIWVGVGSQIIQGKTIKSGIVSIVNTELSLVGISRANLVMTGGGMSGDATPYSFSLEQIE